MKKAFNFLLGLAVLSLFLFSCKSHERCPAYGKANPTENFPS